MEWFWILRPVQPGNKRSLWRSKFSLAKVSFLTAKSHLNFHMKLAIRARHIQWYIHTSMPLQSEYLLICRAAEIHIFLHVFDDLSTGCQNPITDYHCISDTWKPQQHCKRDFNCETDFFFWFFFNVCFINSFCFSPEFQNFLNISPF